MENQIKKNDFIEFFSAKGQLSMGRFWHYWLLIILGQTGLLMLAGIEGADEIRTTLIIAVTAMGLFYLQIIIRNDHFFRLHYNYKFIH